MKTYRLTIFKGKRGWHWRLRSRNGRIIADGAEGYARKQNATRAARSLPLTWSKVEVLSNPLGETA